MVSGGGDPPTTRPRAGAHRKFAPPGMAAPTAPRVALPQVSLTGEHVNCVAFKAALAEQVEKARKVKGGAAAAGLTKQVAAEIKKLPQQAPVVAFLEQVAEIVDLCEDCYNIQLERLTGPILSVIQPVFVSALAMGAPKIDGKSKATFAQTVLRHCSKETVERGLIQMMVTEWKNPETFLRSSHTFCETLQKAHLARLGLPQAGVEAIGPDSLIAQHNSAISLEEARKLNQTWRSYQVPKVLREYVRRQSRRLKNMVEAGEQCAQRFISDRIFLKHLAPKLASGGEKRGSIMLLRVVNGVQQSAKTGDIDDAPWAELQELVRAISIQVTPPPGS